jgi:DNA replication and repair protein RecF
MKFRRPSLLIKSLKLRDFRNYGFLSMEFEKDYNIIFGNNAQGKTNIIEAIFLCASGRSHRTSKDSELLKTGAPGYYVELQLDREEDTSIIEIHYSKEERKKISVNEIPLKKIGELMGRLNAVIFSPEDLFIIKEGPSERRRFLDITLSQLKPAYFFDLQQYSRVLFQRNSLLKEIENKKELMATIDVWNHHLIKTGSKIMLARRKFLEKLNKKASARHERLTNGLERLSIGYLPSFSIEEEDGIEKIEERFGHALNQAVSRELAKGTTLYGPQRDDYDIVLNGMSTKIYGSQGQQRTSVLSIKLAEIDIMKEETGESPVLLLDDVLSELDSSRQEYLFENIESIQTFITCTDRSFFRKTGVKAKFINIVDGKVI